MELGTGFAFMGQQYHLEVGGKDFYIDLLFYNTKLRCYVAIDLKTGEFKPEQAGKMNFYLSALDDLVKAPVPNSINKEVTFFTSSFSISVSNISSV